MTRSSFIVVWGWVLVIGCILCRTASGQELPFTHYTTDGDERALPSAEVNKVYQDRLGYVWMAVFSSGLVRYDGTRMEVYSTDDGLRDLDVWGVLEDSSGRLWVASNGGLSVSEEPLSAYNQGRRIRFTETLASMPLLNQRVWTHNVAVGRDGAVWAGTSGHGVVRYQFIDSSGGPSDDLPQPTVDTLATTFGESRESAPVLAITVRRDGAVWIAVENGGLLYFESETNTFVRAFVPEALENENVSVLYDDEAGTLWAGTRNGRVLRVAGDAGRREIESIGPRLDATVVSIIVSDDGTLWAATEGGGVLAVSLLEGKTRIIRREHGLLSTNVRHVMQDDEGNLWFAQSAGVSKLRIDHAAFQNYSSRSHAGERPLLPAGGVGSVLSSGAAPEPCSIWAATSEGGAVCINDQGMSEYLQEADGLRSNWVNSVLRDRKGRVWMGTVRGINGMSFDGSPLPVFGTERAVDLSGTQGRLRGYTNLTILSISSTDLVLDQGHRPTTEALWFPGIRHLIGLVDDSWYVFSTAAGLPASVLNTVAMDDAGRLWVGTRDRGLYRTREPLSAARLREWAYEEVILDGEFFGRQITEPIFEQAWSVEDGAPSNNIGPLLWRDSRLWVGTPRGLAVLDGNEANMWALVTRADGLRADNVTSMSFSPVTGSLWIGTNRGLAEIDPDTREVVRTVTQEDGLIDNEVWMYGSVHAGADGSIYFGTAKGIAVYSPHLDRPNPLEPRVRISNVAFSTSGDSHNEVSFEYAALSFANEKAVRFKTRLSGYDREWSPEKSDVKLRYTNLPAFLTERTYTLEVLARNNDGLWATQPVTYAFQVDAPWWLRWWAIGIYFILFAFGVLGFVRMHRTQVVRKEQEKIREREMELTAEAALARSEAAEAESRALAAENERKAVELDKARELRQAYHDLKEAHAHLQTTQAQLVQQEKLASLGQLTAGIAHEIKNPLNFINNFAQLTEELTDELAQSLSSGGDPSEIKAILADLRMNTKKIHEHGRRADGIVKGMMDHARGGGGNRERVPLNRLVDEYVSLAYHGMRTQLSDFSVDVARAFSEDAPEVEVSVQDVGRVLINLLTNALYAVREQSLRTNGEYNPHVRVETAVVDDAVEIRIVDNGPGIEPHVRDKIFEPFFTTKPAGSGTGLGLSLAYDIVTNGHGGSLTVSDTSGGGATFIIRLPRPPELAAERVT